MDELDIINENQLGIAAQNENIKTDLEGQFRAETGEVGLYIAMARVAQRQGFPEIAEVLKVIATEEAEHAARYAELNGKFLTVQKKTYKKCYRAR